MKNILKNNKYTLIYLYIFAGIVIVLQFYFLDLLSVTNIANISSPDSKEYFSAVDLFFTELRGHPTRPVGFPILLKILLVLDQGIFNYHHFLILQTLLWAATITFVYKTICLFQSRSVAFIGAVSFITCIGFTMRFLQIMTEPFYGFLLSLFTWLLLSGQVERRNSKIYFAWFLLCFTVIVRPTLFFSVIFFLPFLVYYFYQQKSITFAAMTVLSTFVIIGGQTALTYKSTKAIKLSFIGDITLYFYHDAYLTAMKRTTTKLECDELWGEIKDQRKAQLGLSIGNFSEDLLEERNWPLLSKKIKKEFWENITDNPRVAFLNYIQILVRNSLGGSGNLLHVKSNHPKLTYFLFIISRIQNFIFTSLCFIFSCRVFMRWKNYKKFEWKVKFVICTVLMNIILLSPVSLAQGDRLHVVVYPIVLVILFSFGFRKNNMKINKTKRFLRRFITVLQNFNHSFRQKLNPIPLIVLGNQKSGTTAVAGLLSKATKNSVALDLPGLNEPVISQIHNKKLAFDKAVNRYLYKDFCKGLIKEPMLTFLYEDELQKHYPESSYLFIIRHPLQNIRSQLNWIKVSGKEQYLDLDNPNLTPERLRVFNNAGLPIDEKHLIKNLALRWNYCAQLYLRYQENFTLIKYEDFLADKANYIEKLALQLEMRVESNIANQVDYQFQPKGQSSISLKDFFGIENYNTILHICQPFMKEIGYNEEP